VSGSIIYHQNVEEKGSVSTELNRLQTLIKKNNHDDVAILKMDIEGSEYKVFDDFLRTNLPVKQLLVEFHHRFFAEGASRTKRIISKLNDSGYRVFGVSKSNMEVSLIRIE